MSEKIKTFHPAAAIFSVATVFSIAMIWSNPAWLFLLLAALAAVILSIGGREVLAHSLRASLPIAILICLINSVISQEGETTIFAGPPRVCLESLIFGTSMGLRIILAVLIFSFWGMVADPDDVLTTFSRIAPKSSLALVLATLMVPRLRRERRRIHMVMSLRGAPLDGGRFSERMAAIAASFHVLLISSLERAWDTAASLTCRGFGAAKRMISVKQKLSSPDRILLAGAVVTLVVFISGSLSSKGSYDFYPRLANPLPLSDLPHLILILSTILGSYAAAERIRRCACSN